MKGLGSWIKRMSSKSGEIADELGRYPNVAYVTLGEKRKEGMRVGEPALIVYVKRKEPGEALDAGHSIPERVDVRVNARRVASIATDVVELTGRPRTLGARGGDLVLAGDGDFGTATLAFRKGDNGYIATNAHVIGNIGLRRWSVGSLLQEPLTGNKFPLGPVVYMSTFEHGRSTDEDLAVLSTGNIAVDHMSILGEQHPVNGFGDFASNPNGQYWYATNGGKTACGFAERTPDGHDIPMLVDGVWYPYRNFWALHVTGGIAAPGHSGSVVCRGSGSNIVACGILFGGVPPNLAYVFPIQPIFSRMLAVLP